MSEPIEIELLLDGGALAFELPPAVARLSARFGMSLRSTGVV
jgi:hypothetical protein